MAQAIRSNRRGRAAMNTSLSRAFEIGIQPEQNKNLAIVVTAQNRKKFPLITKEGKVTDAGRYWYEGLHKAPDPTLYQYEQPPMWDTHVQPFGSNIIQVRKKGTRLMGLGLSQHLDAIISLVIV